MIKSKMGNIKVVIDGITFASKREGRRYQELKFLEKHGKIGELKCQVRFELIPAVYFCIIDYPYHTRAYNCEKLCNSCKCVQKTKSYIADFTYYEEKRGYVVEDVKPRNISDRYRKTEVYKRFLRKKKLMKIIYNIEVGEV